MSSDLKLNGQDLVVIIQCDEPFLKKNILKILFHLQNHTVA